jgi:curved DNA-binding protein CbpA
LKDYYKILGIKRNATNVEIIGAYTRCSFIFHPKVNKLKSAARKFAEIKEAYETLIHKPSRTSYDIALKVFESNNSLPLNKANYGRPLIFVDKNIPYAAGIAGTPNQPNLEVKKEPSGISFEKIIFWIFLMAMISMSHKK